MLAGEPQSRAQQRLADILLYNEPVPHQRQLTAIIEREGSGYVSLCPELDIASQGDSIEEARQNLREALDLFLEAASPGEIEER